MYFGSADHLGPLLRDYHSIAVQTAPDLHTLETRCSRKTGDINP